jgi:hypothetical protein
VDDPLDPDGGVSVSAGPPERLDVTLGLRWRGARPVVGEDWVGPYYTRFWEGGDTRRSAVGCAPPTPPDAVHPCAARYTIGLPATTTVRARTTGAPIDVHGVRRESELATRTGRITLDGVGGYVTATSENGDVVGAAIDAGQIHVHAGGRIDLRLVAHPAT